MWTHAGLRGAVDEVARERGCALHRRDVHDRAAPVRQHPPHRDDGPRDRSREEDAKAAVDLLLRHLVRGALDVDAGVVDPAPERAERLGCVRRALVRRSTRTTSPTIGSSPSSSAAPAEALLVHVDPDDARPSEMSWRATASPRPAAAPVTTAEMACSGTRGLSHIAMGAQ